MKKLIMTSAIATMLAAPAMAQVFLDDEDLNNRGDGADPSGLFIDNPAVYDSGDDWYTPVGEGIFALVGLAGAYLLGKRKNEE